MAKKQGPHVFFDKDCINTITKECERHVSFGVPGNQYAQPYLDIIKALTVIKERSFPYNGVRSIAALEDSPE